MQDNHEGFLQGNVFTQERGKCVCGIQRVMHLVCLCIRFSVNLHNAVEKAQVVSVMLLQALFDEAWAAKQQDMKEVQDNAAKRTIRKMEEKVNLLHA